MPLAGCSSRQYHRCHGGSHPDTDRAYRSLDALHGVDDGEAGGDVASRRIDIQVDGQLVVVRIQKKELRYHPAGGFPGDFLAEEDNPVLQKRR